MSAASRGWSIYHVTKGRRKFAVFRISFLIKLYFLWSIRGRIGRQEGEEKEDHPVSLTAYNKTKESGKRVNGEEVKGGGRKGRPFNV